MSFQDLMAAKTRQLPTVQILNTTYYVRLLAPTEVNDNMDVAKRFAAASVKNFSDKPSPLALASLGFVAPENETPQQAEERQNLRSNVSQVYGEIDPTNAKEVGLAYIAFGAFSTISSLSRLYLESGQRAFDFSDDSNFDTIRFIRENPDVMPNLDDIRRPTMGNDQSPDGSQE